MLGAWVRAGALAVAALAAAVAPAGAAEVLGSDLTGDGDVASSVDTARAPGTPPTASTTALTPSAAGVVVSLRLKHGTSGANPGTHAYPILSGTLPNLTARTDLRLASVPAPANATPGVLSIVPADGAGLARGIPIAPGERMGYSRLGGTGGEGLRTVDTSAPGGTTFTLNTATHTSGAATYTADGGNRELLLQYTVEPDADGDTYGDESQDACPALPGPCLPAPAAGPAQIQIQRLPTFGGAPNVSLALRATKSSRASGSRPSSPTRTRLP